MKSVFMILFETLVAGLWYVFIIPNYKTCLCFCLYVSHTIAIRVIVKCFVQTLYYMGDNASPRLARVVSMSFSMYTSVRDSQASQIALWSAGCLVIYYS